MKYKPSNSKCSCGKPRRANGRYCNDCHATKQKEYRAAMKQQALALESLGYVDAVREFKRRLVTTAIKQEGGNLCRAAVRLGVHRNTMNRVMRGLQLTSKQVREYLGSQKQVTQ